MLLVVLVVRIGPPGIFEGLLDRATTRPRPAPEEAAEEVDSVLLKVSAVPIPVDVVPAAGAGVDRRL